MGKHEVPTGPLQLLIIQGTPFCNIDCDYCYLPDRLSTEKISMETVDEIFGKLFSSSIVRDDFTVVWHAGEPLTMPVEFYEEAFERAKVNNKSDYEARQYIQTNGLLLNQDWCDLIKENDVNLGLSIDGPKFIHNSSRKRRTDEGTHDEVMESVRLLKDNNISFKVITVLTKKSLEHPEEIFNFYIENNIKEVGFNVEEVEGINKTSSMQSDGTINKFKSFMNSFYELCRENEESPNVREFRNLKSLMYSDKFAEGDTQQTTPYKIINFDCEGNFSTFSPELLSMDGEKYGGFQLGNIHETSLEEAIKTKKFRKIYADILEGVKNCKSSCPYFPVCGGGSPSNKLSENGTFKSTETMHCRFRKKSLVDVVLRKMEEEAGI